MNCICSPTEKDGFEYIQWIGTIFGDCIYTPQEIISFILAWVGVIASMFSLFPQLYTNYRNGSVEGLSIGLALFWTFGDITNLAGTILAHQLPTQIWAAALFLFIDICLLLQFIYYRRHGYQRIPDREDVVVEDNTGISPLVATLAIVPTVTGQVLGLSQPLCDFRPVVQEPFRSLGHIFAWCSGILYLCSRYFGLTRIPQVYKNFKRKSVSGLSFYMFGLSIVGNVGYGFSVLLRLDSNNDFYRSTFPYLVGSLGVLAFDFFTLFQAGLYGGFDEN